MGCVPIHSIDVAKISILTSVISTTEFTSGVRQTTIQHVSQI